jgi:hypothetical protein
MGSKTRQAPLCFGELGSAISRIIIADDDFMFEANLRKRDRRTSNVLQRALNELFFIKSRNNNRTANEVITGDSALRICLLTSADPAQ